jgi:amino acid adenylation domain-containing protein
MGQISRNGDLPLSFAQQRLWFIEQLQPGSSVNNIPVAFRLAGSLNVTALEQSLAEIVRRHEVLRTTFQVVDGQAAQVISPEMTLMLLIIDLRELPETDREAEAQRLAIEEAQQPFDLAQEPLLRLKLLRLAEEEHLLILTMHHLVSDGWSFRVFFQELTLLYEAFSTDKPSPLSELPIQYADFAVWQREWLQGDVLGSQLSYWKQQLSGSIPALQLPTDYPRSPVQTYRGTKQSLELPKNLTDSLKALSQQEGVTLFMTLLAAFKTLLYRYSSQEDIIVGSPIAGRNRVETKGLIGLFVNTLAMRAYLGGNPSFRELLGRVREVALGAYAHQDLPFEKLVEELQLERDLSRMPLFQVMFALHKAPIQGLEFPGLTLNSLEVHSSTAKFDLTLELEETSEGISGWFEYNIDLFDATTIARMANHFQTLLEGIVANPKQHLSDLPLLTAEERHQLLMEWNDTQTDYPKNVCTHQLFETQGVRTPDAIAVVFEDQELTYRELNCRANQLAHYLQTLDVGPEVLVGICVERSFDMIIGLLGILKAGGAYVPIDPAYPEERIAYMLDDSRLPVLLTQQKLVASLPEHQARVVCLDSDWEEISAQRELPLFTGVTPENLAYVIYTSGSTGKPKGVLIAHRGLCNLAQAQIKLFDVQPDSCVLQLATFSFDASIWEIVMALCSGARLCLGTRESLQPGQPLLGLLQQQEITHLTLVPSALAALPSEELPALQNIIVAGEPCPSSLVAQWSGGRRFFNAYGPTESTVCATVAQGFEGMDVLPIGRPIDNTQVYILDRYLQPVPIGVPGELYIASVGLAKGYLNHPDLTAEKFISNPFSDNPNSRLYKTGDKARYLPDGNIEFLGRIDNQVKVRGFRIELGEIEVVLAEHPAVRETVVTAREDIPGNKRLVAYVVPNQEQTPTTDELCRFLKQKLPDYMVPSAFVFLDILPLTPNGKIDRRALPAPDPLRPDLEETFVAPRTPTEQQIADIWTQLLKLEQIGIHDNFFALGGHSLLATQVISRLRQGFGIELPLQTLFVAPTVGELSDRIETIRWASQQSQASASNTTGDYEEGRL